MDNRLNFLSGFVCVLFFAVLSVHTPVFAKSATASAGGNGKLRYIVILDDPPLAAYDGRNLMTPERDTDSLRLAPTANHFTGASKLDVHSADSKQYLQFLDERFKSFRGAALLTLGRPLNPQHRYRNALNGFSTELNAAEAQALRDMPGVKAVQLDEIQYLETDSGPNWIGADQIHDGTAGFPATGGEGVVVGMIDSGVNWDHPSFQDPGEGIPPGNGFWDHVNPYPSQLGLCSDPEVLCNDKLVGVYDFVQDKPGEEFNNGKDNSGHGSHTASTAAGNPVNVTLNGISAVVSGVAPNANIVSYRVCFIGEPGDPQGGGCQTSAILSAIDQAITDAVDVVNYSIGSGAQNPWIIGTTTFAFLNLRHAGIFVATSAGNSGPNPGTTGSPANAPWITAVGNATHDRVFGNALANLTGGDTPAPDDLIGASLTDGIGVRKIVHAKDFGFPLCATGPSESTPLLSECNQLSGTSNPWAPDTFNGEIVVCDRGEYGRVEKGKNLQLAGAGGYILANTEDWGEVIVADDHCLPATHLGFNNSEKLRTWLDTGINHRGIISGFDLFHVAEVGDSIARSSSRGPNQPPVEDIMKPDVIAPGTEILAASHVGSDFAFLNGTSMSSPHVTGAAALLKAVHPDWTPSMINSALIMTATPEQATDFDGSAATVHKRGAGRPRLNMAANAGLYLNESRADFLAANPNFGGDPKELNLPGLIDSGCHNSCTFKRRVTDLVGGAAWNVSAEGFINGVSVNIIPTSFTLAAGAKRLLTINVDLTQSTVVGSWVYGEVRLTSAGLPDVVFPLAVFADGGQLPNEWVISSDAVSGWQNFALNDLAAMPDATFTSGGLVEPTLTVENLPQDPSFDSPYDMSVGLMTVWHDVSPDTLWLHAETLASTSVDLDLFVGRDSNGNGIAEESEELCASTSPIEIEACDLYTPEAGSYWIIVQNWTASNEGTGIDEVTLKSAVVGKDTLSPLAASGNGMVAVGETQTVRLSWDNVNAVPGTELIGAVGVGTNRENPNNIGIIPVTFNKTGIAAAETLVLMNGISRGLTLSANGMHDRSYIDVPPGTDSLTVTANGADGPQSENLKIELYREDFDAAFANAPFAIAPDMTGGPLATATGAGGNGPVVTINGATLVPGRWFAVLKNNRGEAAAIVIKAALTFTGVPIPLQGGLWEPGSRPNIRQGYDFNTAGGVRALLWYTYDEDGNPVWYLAASAEQAGNVWVAELRRFTNDGTLQQSAPVGYVSVTTLAGQDQIFSFVLFGDEGSDRAFPSFAPACPVQGGVKKSYTGIWSRLLDGLGGASVMLNTVSQGYVHYIYDALGRPVWLNAADATDNLPDALEMSIFQWSGFCAVCTGPAPTFEAVGMFSREFFSESNMSWTLDYVLNPPLSGSINRTDDTWKLTNLLNCQ